MGVYIVGIVYLFHSSPLKTLLRHLYAAGATVSVAGTLAIAATWIPDSDVRVPLLAIGAMLRMVYLLYPVWQIWNEKKSEPIYKETVHRCSLARCWSRFSCVWSGLAISRTLVQPPRQAHPQLTSQ